MKLLKTSSKLVILSVVLVAFVTNTTYAQSSILSLVKTAKKDLQSGDTTTVDEKKEYGKVIPKDAITSKGIVTIHQVKNVIYLEIPMSLMGKPMLLAGRVSQTSNNADVIAGQMPQDPMMVQWRADEDKVYLLDGRTKYICDPNEAIAKGFERNHLKPIMKAFPIKTINPVTKAVVIDVTKFFCSDEKFLSPFIPSSIFDGLFGTNRIKGTFKAELSKIDSFKAFEKNIIVKSILSYTVDNEPFTALVTASLILLPEKPMRPRLADSRLGFFTERKVRFSENLDASKKVEYINRWNIAPRAEDVERYKKGELVEPKKQIVYYIDDAFPEKWRQFLKEGVEDWQMAFEKIGFKNAIVAKDYPKESDFDPDDIRNSCIRYASIQTANAMGPSWTDPRSGEIIQGSVYFYHDVLKLLHNWRFIQTSTVDAKAREEVYEMEVMGPLLRYLIAHEIGHTLGLMHNMRGSYAYPVDSLRSPKFCEQYGTTASIMDYARYNYVAQPGDGVTQLLPPRLGLYDYHIIKWGYQPIFEAESAEDEAPVLDQWIREKGDDPMYRYGHQEIFGTIDPASQTEAIGDDAIKAGGYGIKNLKVIMKNLVEWTAKEGKDYTYTKSMYGEVLKQYNRYIGHVEGYLGGNYYQYPVYGDTKKAFVAVEKAKQKEALKFIVKSIAELPSWMLDKNILSLFEPENDVVYQYQINAIRSILSPSLLGKIGFTAKGSDDPYTPSDYLNDVYELIWDKSIANKELTAFDMNMQYVFIHTLFGTLNLYETEVVASKKFTDLMREDLLPCYAMEYGRRESNTLTANTKESDLKIDARKLYYIQLKKAQDLINKRVKTSKGALKNHYEYLAYEINKALAKNQ